MEKYKRQNLKKEWPQKDDVEEVFAQQRQDTESEKRTKNGRKRDD